MGNEMQVSSTNKGMIPQKFSSEQNIETLVGRYQNAKTENEKKTILNLIVNKYKNANDNEKEALKNYLELEDESLMSIVIEGNFSDQEVELSGANNKKAQVGNKKSDNFTQATVSNPFAKKVKAGTAIAKDAKDISEIKDENIRKKKEAELFTQIRRENPHLTSKDIDELKLHYKQKRFDKFVEKLFNSIMSLATKMGASVDDIKDINKAIQQGLRELRKDKVITDKQYIALSDFFNKKTVEICAEIKESFLASSANDNSILQKELNGQESEYSKKGHDAFNNYAKTVKESAAKDLLRENNNEIEKIVNDYLFQIQENKIAFSKMIDGKLTKYIDEKKLTEVINFAKEIIIMRISAFIKDQELSGKITDNKKLDIKIQAEMAKITKDVTKNINKLLDEIKNTAPANKIIMNKEEKAEAAKFKEQINNKVTVIKNELEQKNAKFIVQKMQDSIDSLKTRFNKIDHNSDAAKRISGKIKDMQDLINAISMNKNESDENSLKRFKEIRKEIENELTTQAINLIGPKIENSKIKFLSILINMREFLPKFPKEYIDELKTEISIEKIKEKVEDIKQKIAKLSASSSIADIKQILSLINDPEILKKLPPEIQDQIAQIKDDLKTLESASSLNKEGILQEDTAKIAENKIQTPALKEIARSMISSIALFG